MKRDICTFYVVVATLVIQTCCFAGKVIELPKVEAKGGMPLMQALQERKSTRDFDYTKKIDNVTLSEMIWATSGINRADGKRTAGSTRNFKAVTIYVVLEDGVYSYDESKHLLTMEVEGDYRAQTGMQPFVKDAFMNVVFVGDFNKFAGMPEKDSYLMMGVDAGLMSQNLYLYCASKCIGTVVRGSIDKDAFSKLLKLPSGKKVILAQTISYPK